jgi:hypothetical protein
MKKAFRALIAYLKDWKNLLAHTLIGVGLVVMALYLPVHPLIRVAILIAVVTFNILRGRREKARKARAIESEATV